MSHKLANGQFLRITELFAFVAKDKDGHEGLMSFRGPDGTWMPMIGADIKRVEKLKPIADKLAAGQKYEIRYFTQNYPPKICIYPRVK